MLTQAERREISSDVSGLDYRVNPLKLCMQNGYKSQNWTFENTDSAVIMTAVQARQYKTERSEW